MHHKVARPAAGGPHAALEVVWSGMWYNKLISRLLKFTNIFYMLKYIYLKNTKIIPGVSGIGLLVKNFYPQHFENKPIFQILV